MKRFFVFLLTAFLLFGVATSYATVSETDSRTRLEVSGTDYDFTFKITADSEILVYVIDSDGVSTLKTLTTDYTVVIDTVTDGGTVTFLVIPTEDEVLMVRDVAYTQAADIPVRGGFNEVVIEGALDSLAMQIQQVKDITDTSVKQDITTGITITVPVPEDGKVLGWDGTAGAMENVSLVDSAGAVIDQSFGSAWDANTDNAPSMNSVHDEFILRGYNANSYTTLTAAVAAAGASEATLNIYSALTTDADVTIPATLRLHFYKGGSLTIASGKTVTINGTVEAGFYQIFTGDGTVTFSAPPYVKANWYGDVTTDVGAALNKAMLGQAAIGIHITLPGGVLPCTTTIDLENIIGANGAVVTIRGAGRNDGHVTPLVFGTLIDGNAMTTNVLQGGQTQSQGYINLWDFGVKGGTSGDCIVIGTATYNTARSTFLRLATYGGAYGMKFYQSFDSVFDHLYARYATTSGFYIWGCNSSNWGMITARTNAGTWAVDIYGGGAWHIDNLYIESNVGGALRMAHNTTSLTIDNIYCENNNTGGASDYEFIFGDRNISASDMHNIYIGYINITSPSTPFAEAEILIDQVSHFDISWNDTNNLGVTPFGKVISPAFSKITFRHCDRTVDLSEAGLGCTFVFNQCAWDTAAVTNPAALGRSSIQVIGGDKRLKNIHEAAVASPATRTMDPWEHFLTVDTTLYSIAITLPHESNVGNAVYAVSKSDSGSNVVTITGNTQEIAGTGTVTLRTKDETAMFRNQYAEGFWYHLNAVLGDFRPIANDIYYLGKNDDDAPSAWKGVILKDTTDGKYYRIEVISGSVTATDLSD